MQPTAGSYNPTPAEIQAILAKTVGSLTLRELAILKSALGFKSSMEVEATLSSLLP